MSKNLWLLCGMSDICCVLLNFLYNILYTYKYTYNILHHICYILWLIGIICSLNIKQQINFSWFHAFNYMNIHMYVWNFYWIIELFLFNIKICIYNIRNIQKSRKHASLIHIHDLVYILTLYKIQTLCWWYTLIHTLDLEIDVYWKALKLV